MTKVAVDIGGTFTDIVMLSESGAIETAKSFSTPQDFSIGILNALNKLNSSLEHINEFVHGTTVALNTLLQRRGALTGLITTSGFRDVIEIMRTNRPDMYNLQQIKPEPLVPRHLRREVLERIDARGNVLVQLDEKAFINELKGLIKQGVTSLAICFINSYLNPVHEQRAKAIVAELFPELSVSISAEVIQEWREFERTSTTVVNSYCKPNVEKYVHNLASSLKEKGFNSSIRYMQSNGGLMSEQEFANTPVKSLLSGPVGGVTAGEYFSKLLQLPELITLDIGGTSADISVISNFKATYSREKEINRIPILQPTVDIHTIGAGGGSIAWIDKGGGLQVGPHSAGSYPGPICYDNGGERTTVTDANVLLGYIDEKYFLGGEITLNKQQAYDLTLHHLAQHFKVSVEDMAYGIIQVINAKMSLALKEVLIKGGHDPRDFSLIAFGGGGGLHAVELARELNIPKVIIPIHPSVFSAVGMLSADIKYDLSITSVNKINQIVLAEFNRLIKDIKEQVNQKIIDSSDKEVESSSVHYLYSVQMRYSGQEYTLEIPFFTDNLQGAHIKQMELDFIEKHQAFYGYNLADEIMLTNLKVTATWTNAMETIERLVQNEAKANPRKKDRLVYLSAQKKMDYVPVYERTKLPVRAVIEGPAIIEDRLTTITMLGNDIARIDEYGNILIQLGGRKDA